MHNAAAKSTGIRLIFFPGLIYPENGHLNGVHEGAGMCILYVCVFCVIMSLTLGCTYL